MLTAYPKRARLFHDTSLANEDTYEPFLRLLWGVSARLTPQDAAIANGASKSKEFTTNDDVLKGLVEWLCTQLKKPSHPSRGIPTAINCLATLLKEPVVRSCLFKQRE
ncbi:V-type proton ATPase subunit H [Forsythia ovata]|uniref:V-type proton ATPase subunit H n=1 Tax=Forsythia ovata TaxID=205694 RepID=A0ABD1RIJ2_9LAMI